MNLTNEDIEKLLESLVERERQERLAMAPATSEVLSKLNISIDNLPQKCQEFLQDGCTAQTASIMDEHDPVSISLCQTREIAEKLDNEYEILLLRQKNKEVQAKIDRNAKVIDGLRRDLAQSRHSLASLTPGPETVQEYCRERRQKVALYEENWEKTKTTFSLLAVPEEALPRSLTSLAATLAQLRAQESALKERAEEVALVQQARRALLMLKK